MQFEHNLEAIAFPRFDELMLAGLSCCPRTKLKRYRDGERLFTAGDRDFKFFIVKSGEIEIVDESGDEPKTVTVHGPGHFTGEVAQISGGTAIVSGIARGDIEVYEVTNDALREIVNDHPDLGDVILQAFIVRRQLLRALGGFTGLRVIGSRFSADCFRVRDFLTKNRAPFTWLDLEDDPLVADARAVRPERGRYAGGGVGPEPAPAKPVESRARRGAGAAPPAVAPVTVDSRPGGGRRRSSGPGRGGLWGLGRTEHDRPGTRGARRSGRSEHADRELPRFSDRHHRCRPG